jgi:hypothetical protein
MSKHFENWSIGNGEIYLYTEESLVAEVLRALTATFTTYEKNGRVFAWQFRVPESKLSFVEKEISRKIDIELQRVRRVA